MNSMNETAVVVAIDRPGIGETIQSPHYTIRIVAPLDAEMVEISVDRTPWRLCRYASGYWWFDWWDYLPGEHSARVRVRPFDDKGYVLADRAVRVAI
jgi:hypothetical protein